MVSVYVKLINKNDNKENTITFNVDNFYVKNEADTVLNFMNDMSFIELHEKTKAYELDIYVKPDKCCQLTVPTNGIYWVRYFGNN